MATTALGICCCVLLNLYIVAGQSRPIAIYAFGDSYLDTGNVKGNNFVVPYGETFPGYPAGRFSDGRNFLDWLASGYNMSTPPPYFARQFNTSFAQGANFAVGGAGITNVFSAFAANLSVQASAYVTFAANNSLSASTVANSLFVISLSGNDYQQFAQNPALGNDLSAALNFISSVVRGIIDVTNTLYAAGARNFVIFNLSNLGCVPIARSNTTGACLSIAGPLVTAHNSQLDTQLSLQQSLKADAKFLTANFFALTTNIASNPASFGFVNGNSSCCGSPTGFTTVPNCGAKSSDGTPIYSLCSNPSVSLYWDAVHPTDAGWKIITQTMFNGTGYTAPGANIVSFFNFTTSASVGSGVSPATSTPVSTPAGAPLAFGPSAPAPSTGASGALKNPSTYVTALLVLAATLFSTG